MMLALASVVVRTSDKARKPPDPNPDLDNGSAGVKVSGPGRRSQAEQARNARRKKALDNGAKGSKMVEPG
jgi:hypothetical protein